MFDADAEVHRLYAGGKAVDPVERAFPGTTTHGGVDRAKLSAALVDESERVCASWKQSCIRWSTRSSGSSFTSKVAKGAEKAVLEIPLLFETGGEKRVDVTIVVSAPPEVQRQQRFFRTAWHDGGKARPAPLASSAGRRETRGADFVVDTCRDIETRQAALDDRIIAEFGGDPGGVSPTLGRFRGLTGGRNS